MRKASSCLQKNPWWTEILRKVRMPFLLPGGKGRSKGGGSTTILFSVRENKPSSFKCTNSDLRRKQSQGKLACNTRQSEHICQMSEIGSGCAALCVFLILGNKGPLFPREAAGRNLALWLALAPSLCAAFSCISWYHPSEQQLMKQDTQQQPHRNKQLAHSRNWPFFLLVKTLITRLHWLFFTCELICSHVQCRCETKHSTWNRIVIG